MGYILKVDGISDLGTETIQTVDFSVETPADSNARTTDVAVTLKVTGKILTLLDGGTEATKDLALWSMIPAEQANCYRNVVVTNTTAGMVIREYTLPNAFVVDYKEIYGDTEGVGTFELVLKQKKDKIKTTTITGGYGA